MRTLKLAPCRGSAGFTLVETMIATTVMAVVLSAIGLTVMSGKDTFSQSVSSAVVESRAHRLLDRIVAELQWAGVATLPTEPTLPSGDDQIEFRSCTGFVGAAQAWSDRTFIALVADPDDPRDGLDNDSDGVIDEGQVVLTRDLGGPNEIQVVLGDGVALRLEGETANGLDDNGNGLVDEGGLSFVIDGDRRLIIRLTLEARDPRGQPLLRTVQTSVTMRN